MMLTIWMMMTMVQLQVCDNQERGSRANNPHIMERPLPHWDLFCFTHYYPHYFDALLIWWFFWKVLATLVFTRSCSCWKLTWWETRPISCLRKKWNDGIREGEGGLQFHKNISIEWTAFAILAMFLPSSYEASDFWWRIPNRIVHSSWQCVLRCYYKEVQLISCPTSTIFFLLELHLIFHL